MVFFIRGVGERKEMVARWQNFVSSIFFFFSFLSFLLRGVQESYEFWGVEYFVNHLFLHILVDGILLRLREGKGKYIDTSTWHTVHTYIHANVASFFSRSEGNNWTYVGVICIFNYLFIHYHDCSEFFSQSSSRCGEWTVLNRRKAYGHEPPDKSQDRQCRKEHQSGA